MLAQARPGCWHALVESLSSQGCRTEQACQHTGVRQSRPRSGACLILPSGAVSVGQGVLLLIQVPLVPKALYLTLITVSLLKDGCILDPQGNLANTAQRPGCALTVTSSMSKADGTMEVRGVGWVVTAT